MRQISEYLLSKTKTKITGNDELIIHTIEEFFQEPIGKSAKEEIKKHCDAKEFEHIRIYGDEAKIDRTLKNGTVKAQSSNEWLDTEELKGLSSIVFNNLMAASHSGDIIADAVEDEEYDYFLTYDSPKYEEYHLCLSPDFIYFENDDGAGLMFEKIESEDEANIDFKTYWSRHTEYLELSSRKILWEVEVPEGAEDAFDSIYNELVDQYVEDFESEGDTEVHIGGNGGRHVCVTLNFKNLHNYAKLKKLCEEFQDQLVSDLKAEAQVIKDEMNEN